METKNYDRIIKKISDFSGLSKEEIERRIEAKRAKLSGLISPEGAAQVIAAELGVSFENEKLNIDELLPGMRKVNVVGKVVKIFPVRSFTTKKGDAGKVSNMIIADKTGNIKVVLWDTNHIELIEKGAVQENVVIEISNASMRDNELHLGSFSDFKPSQEILDDIKTEKLVREKPIVAFSVSDNVSTRAFIVQSFEPKFFYVCTECKKKAVQENAGEFVCAEHGKVVPEKRALMNVVIDDGTETIKAVAFHETLKSLGITELEDKEKMMNQRENLLGKEMVFSGNVRMNKFFNNPEFIIESIKEINLDEMIAKLEMKN